MKKVFAVSKQIGARLARHSQGVLRLKLFVLLMLLSPTAFAVDVKDAAWGFDGRVVNHDFNMLTVVVDNPTDEDFDGVLTLVRSTFGGASVGARLIEPITVSRFSQRVVQFYPYCNETDGWVIRWGDSNSFPVPPPNTGKAEAVLLVDRNDMSTRSRGLKRFSDEHFPPYVSATKGLKTMVMGHVPRWEGPRRQAFIDWLKLGGVLHLLHSSDGDFPKFEDQLSELNSPLALQHLGAGVVFRHNWPADQLSADSIRRMAAARAQFLNSDDAVDPDLAASATTPAGQMNGFQNMGLYDADNNMFGTLKEMTRPDHNWTLIYLLSFVYIGLIFPGCFLLGRRRVHYLVTYGAILGCVAVFSLIFLFVGRRGYGEQSAVHSVAIAQQIAGSDEWDINQFSNVFATAGDTYELTHQGTGRLYSTCSTSEVVNGDINNGRAGVFNVDIPPFSNRSFANRMKVRMPQLPVSLVAFMGQQSLTRFDLEAGAGFPEKPIKMFVQYRDQIHVIKREGDILSADKRSVPMTKFLSLAELNSYGVGTGWGVVEEADKRDGFEQLWRLLAARHQGALARKNLQAADSAMLPTDRARLYVFAEGPEQLHIASERFQKQEVLVLYAIDIFRNEINVN